MRFRLSQGLKPKLIEQMAMLMSICYLLGPLQPQLSLLLHELSHGLEMPTAVLSHENTAYAYSEVHDSHEHDSPKADHDHKLVDLVDSILEASNESHEPDKALAMITKVKKHAPSEVLVLFSNYLEKKQEAFFTFKTTLNLGHPKVAYHPPQLLIT